MFYRTRAFAGAAPLLLLSAAFSQIISGRSDPQHAVISAEFSPKEPLFASGSTMEFNGTLINATPGVTARQVFCTFDGSNLTVVVLNDDTFQIRRENVTRQMTQGHIYCYLNILGTSTILPLPTVVIRVADIPVVPNITGCVVYNWKRMVCTWEQPKDTGLDTTYKLGWTLLSNKELESCNCPQENSCLWDISPCGYFKMDLTYYMRMTARNDLKNVTSDLYPFHTSNLVKPDRISNLHAKNIGSQSVDLSWTYDLGSPDDHPRSLIYRVNYTSEWHSESMETTSNNTNLKGLVPNTGYTISVECAPYKNSVRNGFWSDESVINFSTDEDVPGRAPAFADGSYHRSKTTETESSVEIFWQPVSPRWLHGELRLYRIRCFNYWNRSHLLLEEHERGGTELTVRGQQDLIVTIDACTLKGCNDSLDLKKLVVPPVNLAPAKPEIVHAVRNLSEITVMWSSVSNASSYTVYWCRKNRYGRCQESYNWISVSSDVNNFTISVGSVKHDGYNVALSVEMYVADLKQNLSSGMMMAACVPDINNNVKPPESVEPSSEQKAFSLSLKWSHPKCEETAYILKFEISYCQIRNCIDDVCCFDNKTMFVANHETVAMIKDLTADFEYEVAMRSISFANKSDYSPPFRHTVHRSGLTAGVIAAIVIAAIVLLLLLVLGLLTIAKRIKKCCHFKEIEFKPPPLCRLQIEDIESSHVQFYKDGNNMQLQTEEGKSLLHDGTTTKQESDAETGTVFIQRNGHPNITRSFQPLDNGMLQTDNGVLQTDNGILQTGRNDLATSGVAQSHDSSISSYTHLAVPDESALKEPNSFAEIGHVSDPSSDRASHILPRIAADAPSQTLDDAEQPVSSREPTSAAVEKTPLPVGSTSSSTIAPYTTVEQTFDMAEPKNFPESGGCLPAGIGGGDDLQQVETPPVDCHNTKSDDYQQVSCPIDDYVSGSLAGVANVQDDSPINAVNNAGLTAEVRPLYANHQTAKSEDGYSDQHDFEVGSSSMKPLLPVGYIPLAPTLST